MSVIGLDIGSMAAKGVFLQGEQTYFAVVPTGWSPREASQQLISSLLEQARLTRTDVDKVVATGYGRVAMENVDKTATEITCHARGVAALVPGVCTIIDIGGQDSKVIRLNERAKVVDFAMNDKCAAGTGRFLQVMATALGMDVAGLGTTEDPSQVVAINSMCTVFAESEIIGLLATGVDKGGLIAGLHQSVGKRVAAMARKIGIGGTVAFTGGVAKNPGVRRALSEELGVEIITPENCQFTGALGAALMARDLG